MNQEKIRHLGLEIRKRFIDQKRIQTGVFKYRPAKRFDQKEIWDEIAQLMLEHGGEPVGWVAAAFEFCTIPNGPFPQNLKSKAAVRWFELYEQEHNDAIASNVVYDFNLIGDYIKNNPSRSMEEILLDEYLPFKAYARCIIGKYFESVRERWYKEAEKEFKKMPTLKQQLEDFDIDVNDYFDFDNSDECKE